MNNEICSRKVKPASSSTTTTTTLSTEGNGKRKVAETQAPANGEADREDAQAKKVKV
jgi:hypothetical protein